MLGLDTIAIGTILKFGLISLIPILAWIVFFQKQHRERTKFVVLTFLAGMLSILPIKLYEKFWNQAVLYFENINLFQYLADLVKFPEISKLMSFIIVSGIVAAGLFLFTAVMMGILEIISRDNSARTFQKKFAKIMESPFLFVSMGVLFGGVAYAMSSFMPNKVWFFVVVGMLEEFIKYLVLRFTDEEKINSVSDAISFAILVALGFAFVENIIYLQKFWDSAAGQSSGQFTLFFLLRSTFSVIAHVCFSAILGYFYGRAHFSKEMYAEEVSHGKHPILRVMHKILHVKGSVLFHEEKLMEGMIIAMACHAIFNSLLEYGKILLIVPFLITTFFLILHLLHQKDGRIKFGHFLNGLSK